MQWIAQLLGNEWIDDDRVIAPFAGVALQRASDDGQRVRNSALAKPCCARTRVKEAEGAMGIAAQTAALEVALALLPKDAKVAPMGGRFYGSPDVGRCGQNARALAAPLTARHRCAFYGSRSRRQTVKLDCGYRKSKSVKALNLNNKRDAGVAQW